jgi:hypothetical protein
MKMTPQIATMRIQRELAALEETLAEGLERAASLTATMARARADTGAGLATGHDLLVRLAAVQSGLLKANADTARVHQGLLHLGRELGYVDELCHFGSLTRDASEAA